VPVVTVFLSGRQLWLNRELNASDAFVAAWLPGSEGAGIADVLLRDPEGRVQHDVHGRLSFAWPRTPVPAFDRPGGIDADPLFAIGYGLRYGDAGDLPVLDESPGEAIARTGAGVFLARGEPAPGWRWRFRRGTDGGEIAAAEAAAAVATTRTDHAAQEDALRLSWRGQTTVVDLSGDTPIDLRRESNGDVDLLLTLRIDGAAPSRIGVGCADRCTVWLPWPDDFVPRNTWQQVAIALKCFQDGGADLGRLDAVLSIEAQAPAALALSRVELGTGTGTRIGCRPQLQTP
jgi:beta-glucosidase